MSMEGWMIQVIFLLIRLPSYIQGMSFMTKK
jgi:hypothetical protein